MSLEMRVFDPSARSNGKEVLRGDSSIGNERSLPSSTSGSPRREMNTPRSPTEHHFSIGKREGRDQRPTEDEQNNGRDQRGTLTRQGRGEETLSFACSALLPIASNSNGIGVVFFPLTIRCVDICRWTAKSLFVRLSSREGTNELE